MSKYEAGQRRIDLVELKQIAEALGVKLVDLVRKFETPLRTRKAARRRTSK